MARTRTTHGLSGTLIYGVWRMMRARCSNPNDQKFRYCGAIGIEVCPEWNNDFIPFYDWAMRSGYAIGLSIDRIDKRGDFTPENCRWTLHPSKTPTCKLDVEKVHAIRGSSKSGSTVRELSAQYNVSVSHIYSILNGTKWKDV